MTKHIFVTGGVASSLGKGLPAACAIDGRDLGPLAEGDRVTCTASERTAHLVTFGGRNFLQLLKAKFGLDDR